MFKLRQRYYYGRSSQGRNVWYKKEGFERGSVVVVQEIENERIKIVAYLRVSTDKQRIDLTIEQQEQIINDYIKNNPDRYKIVKWFKDDGKSGTIKSKYSQQLLEIILGVQSPSGLHKEKRNSEKRSQYNLMLEELVNNDGVLGVIAKDIKRIARSNFELTIFREILNILDKKLILTDRGEVDLNSSSGRFIYTIESGVSEKDRDDIYQKLALGRKRAKENGVVFGRKPKYVPKEVKKQIITWYKKGLGVHMISDWIKNLKYTTYEKEIKVEKIGFNLSPATILRRLYKWSEDDSTIVIRPPKNTPKRDGIRKKDKKGF